MMHFTSIHITDEQQEFLEKRRTKLKISVAKQIREAIDNYIEKHNMEEK